MDKHTLWSLRLGFSGKQSGYIKQQGIEKFLENSFAARYDNSLPAFLEDDPKTVEGIKEFNLLNRSFTDEQKNERQEAVLQKLNLLKGWWIEKMISHHYPLREKMVCMLHNHFVVNARKVKTNYWLYQHNTVLREHAFGNLKELTKKMVKSNAMIIYLDNNTNRKNKINENLSRELLELFTLGIGNYKEQDIAQGAKALAGLEPGDKEAKYNFRFTTNDSITYLGRTGKFNVDAIIDIIFDQPSAPYLFTRKVLQWIVYDSPPEELVKYYGDYLRKQDFEIKPLLQKICVEEFGKNSAGSKIKDPLVYILQLADEAGLKNPNPLLVNNFIRDQGMNLYGQSNVKGWAGGYSWLTSQVYMQRNKIADRLCMGYNLNVKPLENFGSHFASSYSKETYKPEVKWQSSSIGNKAIINQLKERLLFDTDEEQQKNLEQVLKYDFDPKSPNADEAVLRLFNYMVKTPEFQLI